MFEYKDPYLYRDKTNKKWCIRYSIRYEGEAQFTPRKEYGKKSLGTGGLNRIKDLKEREKKAEVLRKAILADLADGIDPDNVETVQQAIERKLQEAKRFSFDTLFGYYCKLKGYENPAPKKVLSAANIKAFFNNQFKPFLVENKLDSDLRLVTKKHILDFGNFFYLNSDENLKWNNTTYNNRISGFIGGFFKVLVQEDILQINPVDTITRKPKQPSKRYPIFTKEELTILFEYLKEKDVFMNAVAHCIHYAYLRESEVGRLNIEDFDLEKRKIRIRPEQAKGQRDGLTRTVLITKELLAALQLYLSTYPEYNGDWFMFGRKFRPSTQEIKWDWQRRFRRVLDELKELHPNKFQTPNLSLYGLKHTGVTYFVNDNIKKHGKLQILKFVQSQCRHQTFSVTENYLRKLEADLDEFDDFFSII